MLQRSVKIRKQYGILQLIDAPRDFYATANG